MTDSKSSTQTNSLLTENALRAFSKLCCVVEANQLVSVDECQYWVFEEGYKAALAQFEAQKTIA